MKMIIVILTIMIMILPIIFAAEPTQQFSKLKLDPLYRQSMTQDQDYNYTISINPPDGFTEIQSAIITFQLWINPTIEFFLEVNGKQCNTASYEVHTTYANAGEGTIYFDCSNVIKEKGDYTITLTPDDDTGAVTGWLDITYINKPKPTLELHGTEYKPGDRAKLWVQLLNESNDDVVNGACQLDIYNPVDGIFLEDASMINMEHDGIYYLNLIAPQEQGVYPAIAKCYYDVGTINENVDKFILYTGTPESLDYTKTWELDGDEQKIKQFNGKIDFEYVLDDMCGLNISELLLNGITLSVNVKWTDSITNDDLVMHWYNFSNDKWVEFPNRIIDPNNRITVTNTLNTNNLTRFGLVNSSGNMRIRINDTLPTQGNDKKVEFDWLQVSCNQFTDPNWVEVRGSSEMHISSDKLYVYELEKGELRNNSLLNDFIFHFIVSSQTSQLEVEQEIELPLFTPFPCDHINNVTLTYENGTTSLITWSNFINGDGVCRVRFDLDLEPSTNYNIKINTENYWKVEILEHGANLELATDIINISCQNYVLANNLPSYEIPQISFQNETDKFWLACQGYLDKANHLDTVRQPFLNVFNININFTLDQMNDLQESWQHLKEIENDLSDFSNTIFNGLNLINSYSAELINDSFPPINPAYSIYFANISTSYLNFLQNSNVGVQVWSYNNRTLTEDVTLDNASISNVANNVWNYYSRNLTFYEVTTSQDIWTYNNRTLSSFNFDVTDEAQIWNYYSRNLTFYEVNNITSQEIWTYNNRTLTESGINETSISTNVWNFSQKYIHGTLGNLIP